MTTEVPTDQDLVERAKQGDNVAFGALWSRYERHVLALCRRHLSGAHRDPAVDEHDLAIETFIRALHRLDRYEDRSADGAGFPAWLLEVARRICLSHLAKERRRAQWSVPIRVEAALTDYPTVAAPPGQVAESRDLLRKAAQEINALPETYRAPFKLYLEEYSQREIATALGISVENAAKRVQRARRQLQPRLAAFLDAEALSVVDPTTARPREPAGFRAVERALTDVVSDHQIVSITLPGGGEVQLYLRVDRELARRAPEIEARSRRIASQPRAWKKRLELAELCYHSGRWKEARQAYQEVLSVHPRCFEASLRLGRMLEREEKPRQAAEVYRAALEHAPPPPVAAQLQARRLAAEGRDEQAVKAFRRACRLAPRERANDYDLCEVLGRLSRYEEQLGTLAKLRLRYPDDSRALVGAYTPCARLRRFDLARPLLERAVALDPNDAMAIRQLFQVRMNLRLYDAETQRLA
jgi:RNA polymerase sigma-70 factor (ECF subfamily)